GQRILVAVLTAEGRLHAPDRDQRPGRHAIALLDARKQRALALLQRTAARHDGGSAALGQKLIERQFETSLAPVRRNRCARIVRRRHGGEAGRADARRARLAGELLLPALEAARAVAARRGARCAGAEERSQ